MKKSVLITGATSGIGLQVAQLLSSKGYNTVLVARRQDILKNLTSHLSEKYGVESLSIPFDLIKTQNIGSLFAHIDDLKTFPSHLVYCAGVCPKLGIIDNDVNIMEETFRVNVLSFIEMSKEFMCRNVRNNASIVAISSIAARQGNMNQCLYSSSKAALESAVMYIAQEGTENRTRCNSIAPGAVNTEMLRKLGFMSRVGNAYPYGLIDPDDVASLVEHLLSDKATNITGSCFTMDSGYFTNPKSRL